MPRKTVRSAWELLKRKVKEFEEFSSCSVILVGLVENTYLYEGSLLLKAGFAADEVVQDKFRYALTLSNANLEEGRNSTESENLDSELGDVLQTHVFDMNVALMRKIIDTAITPSSALSSKDKRKGLYQPENSPRWWTDTGLPFTSVNHKSGETGQFRQVELWTLVESLQHYNGIVPNMPSKIPRTETFTSRFYRDESNGSSSLVTDSTREVEDPIPGPSNVVDEEPVEIAGDDPSEPTPSRLRRREHIMNLSLTEVKEDPIKVARVLLQSEDWVEFTVLCNQIAYLENSVPELPAVHWAAEDYGGNDLQDVVHPMQALQTTADGNCLFNALSLIFNGNECMGLFYRLLVIVHTADRLSEIAKYIYKEYQDSWVFFASMISDSEVTDSPIECLERIFRAEAMETLKSFYRDCSIFHIHLVAQVFNRPLQQHCSIAGEEYNLLRKCILPPLDATNRPSIHLAWVPSPANRASSRLSHIVPYVCRPGVYGISVDHCPLLKIECCVFQEEANIEHAADMVVCVTCGQNVHCACAHVDIGHLNFQCGCVNFDKFELRNSNLYKEMAIVEYLQQERIILEIKENITRPGLRKFLHMQRPRWLPNLKTRLAIRMGPFINVDVNHEIMMLLRKHLPAGYDMFIPSVFLHETFVKLIQMIEGVTRIQAEYALHKYSAVQD